MCAREFGCNSNHKYHQYLLKYIIIVQKPLKAMFLLSLVAFILKIKDSSNKVAQDEKFLGH